MKIHFQEWFFVDDNRKININKDFWDGIVINANIVILSEKFIEYQKDLFNEFFADIVDRLSWEAWNDLIEFQRWFEKSLQNLNNKLNIFAEKIKDENRFPIKWLIQIFFNESYMASMIGDVSVMIFRDNKLSYVVNNDVEESKKIDIFWELIEWDIESWDYIMWIWINTTQVIDDEDIEEILWIHSSEEKSMYELFEEILQTRISKEQIWFMTITNVEYEISIKRQEAKQKFFENLKMLGSVKDILLRYRYPSVITLALIFIVFLIYSLLSNFTKNWDVSITNNWTIVADFTPEDLKKEVSLFTKMDPTSDEKTKKYQEIMFKIKLLEEKNKWPQDVIEIKNLLDKEYYKWFNIFLIDSVDNPDLASIYALNDEEKGSLWDLKTLAYNQWAIIWWTKWALVWWMSDTSRWKIIKYDTWKLFEITWCNRNLKQDWLYCYWNEWDIINITKSWITSLETESGQFPKQIKDIWIYGSNNNFNRIYIYTEQKDLNDSWTYVLKYDNVVWSQTKFSKSMHYSFSKEDLATKKDSFLSWFASFAVDGTFLFWNKKTKSLTQMWRDSKTLNMNSREMTLRGGNNIWEWYSDNIRVISNPWSNYVYIFDIDNQSLSVYKSNPYKTNTSYTTSYDLSYFFRIKFNLGENRIYDLFVADGEKPALYAINKLWVYKIKLYEFIDVVSKKN